MIKPYRQTPSARPTKIRDLPRIEESSLIAPNAAAFFGIMLVAFGFMFSGNAQAAEAAAETAQAAGGLSTGMGYLAAALVTGLSAEHEATCY